MINKIIIEKQVCIFMSTMEYCLSLTYLYCLSTRVHINCLETPGTHLNNLVINMTQALV